MAPQEVLLSSDTSGGIDICFPFLPRLFAVVRCVIAGTGCPLGFRADRQCYRWRQRLIFSQYISIFGHMSALAMIFEVSILLAAWLGSRFRIMV